ncbi:MAG: hypothetical protein H6577_14040 [Lewinellaceae bacterium]|nr:hypothetical protein [Saprospiraceae bacterium]MCB9339248.1 hypothetical protein [Lewinellaceae bacterium]
MAQAHALVSGQLLFEEKLADPNSFKIKGGATVAFWEGDDNCTCWEGDYTIPRLIQTDQGFNVKFKWCTIGCLVNALCGDWCLEILMEQKGINEFELPDNIRVKMIPFVPKAGHCYEVTCSIPKNTVPPGIFDICVCITLKDSCGRPLPVAAMGELGAFRFYEDSEPQGHQYH